MVNSGKTLFAIVFIFLLAGCSMMPHLEPVVSENQVLDKDSKGNVVVVSESDSTRAMFMRAQPSEYNLSRSDNVFILKFAIINKTDSVLDISSRDIKLWYGSRIAEALDSSGFSAIQTESNVASSNLIILGTFVAAAAVATDDTGSAHALANNYFQTANDSLESTFSASDNALERFSNDYFSECKLEPQQGCSGLLAFKTEGTYEQITVHIYKEGVGRHTVDYK